MEHPLPPPESAAPRLQGLPPIVSDDTRLLVLGSFPGVASLARQQYYAHPQNQFWKILQALWPEHPLDTGPDSYDARCQWLLRRGLGLWDVYASCERIGSLDSAIRHEEVNDFVGLARRCPQLGLIAFNGAESFKHEAMVSTSVSEAGLQNVLIRKLPSTSPANASWSLARKLAAWREVASAAGLL